MKKIFLVAVLLLAVCFLMITAGADEIILADTDSVYVKITGMEQNADSFEMKLYLENKSGANAMFTLNRVVVNGYVTDPFWACEVSPGKKANSVVDFYDLTDDGITGDVNAVEFVLRVYNNDDWMADDLFNERIVVYPMGEENAVVQERESVDSDIVITDSDNISIVVTGFGVDDLWGYTASVYLVNRTDVTLIFAAEDVSVNGFMVDPFWATEVPPHAREYSKIHWSFSSFEENNIENVDEIEMKFRVYDSDDWMADAIYDEVSIIKP